MLNVARILFVAVILIGPTGLTPAGSAHIVPIDLAGGTAAKVPASESTCPLRAWPYIG
ncbi:hypothetical protein SAMN02799631_01168 [Methylobacterium sp. 174MFSha1.1]|uniref:hypothetical protein n=1 Tax=Methylobacterium sp. 174MFSha1.1 TaxID=1502749 RepID=UPI0008EF94D4|nr:hypothetical protein [Methylobacterium sp. 174MFSha1.1]SFU55328.1 hypothetical protein SAMN02799631_01168 [Methylobacterium sp. 174MFSha1.1]